MLSGELRGLHEQHDPESWNFSKYLEKPEFHLHEYLKTQWMLLYWLMRIGGSILEVGCGTGRGAILAKRLCPHKEVVATDISEKTCKLAESYAELAGADVQVLQADTLALPFPDRRFDVAFSVGVLEHYPDEWIVKALREQARVAECVIVSVPLDHYLVMFGGVGDERPIHHVHWLRLFAKAGLSLASLELLGSPAEYHWLLAILDAGKTKE